jgi:hypothetical protein
MLVIPKKDYPKGLNPIGLKRGDIIEIEVGESTPDYITLDPTTIKLKMMRDPLEPREPLAKLPKPKAPSMAEMPLPDLKTMIQNPPSVGPATPPVPPIVGSPRG